MRLIVFKISDYISGSIKLLFFSII